MKIVGLILGAAVLATSPLAAQTVVKRTVTVQHSEHSGPMMRHNRRKVCTTRWVNHRKVRKCSWR